MSVTDLDVINTGEWDGFASQAIRGPAGALNVRLGGASSSRAVLFNHSILTGSAIWHRQARALAEAGWKVVCLDSRGHGRSPAVAPPYTMDDLVRDNIAVLDALGIERVHFVGVSQGGMTGFGLGIRHADRLASLCICAARADAPPPFAAAWDDRIALVRDKGVDALAGPTVERWFGPQFVADKADLANALVKCIRQTTADGFVGCAQAIQGLSYLPEVNSIRTRTTLIIGSNDTALLDPMRDISRILTNARYEELRAAGHLPQVDKPAEFDRALFRHLNDAP
jgi:3-oxoadipate enol-lactonase